MNYRIDISTTPTFETIETFYGSFCESLKLTKEKQTVKSIVRTKTTGNVILTGNNFTSLKTTYLDTNTIFVWAFISYLDYSSKSFITGKLKLFENAEWNFAEKKCTLEIEYIDEYNEFDKYLSEEINILNVSPTETIYCASTPKYEFVVSKDMNLLYNYYQIYYHKTFAIAINPSDFHSPEEYIESNILAGIVHVGDWLYYTKTGFSDIWNCQIINISGDIIYVDILEIPTSISHVAFLAINPSSDVTVVGTIFYREFYRNFKIAGVSTPPDDSGNWYNESEISVNDNTVVKWIKKPYPTSGLFKQIYNGMITTANSWDYDNFWIPYFDINFYFNNISGAFLSGAWSELYSILDEQTQVSNIPLIVGRMYQLYSKTSCDFTNVGLSINTVGFYFLAIGTTPTAWGDAVLSFRQDLYPYNFEYKNCRDLKEVIKHCVNFIGAKQYPSVIYDFDETATTDNSFYILNYFYDNLKISTMNDIINFSASNFATRAIFKLSDFLDYLFNFFKIGYEIKNSVFRLKHYSQLNLATSGVINDFTAVTRGYNNIKINIELINKIIHHQHDEGNLEFKGAPIYFPRMTNSILLELSTTSFLTDISHIQNFPSKYSDSQAQFVIFDCTSDTIPVVKKSTSLLLGNEVINNSLSISFLHANFYLIDIPDSNVKYNFTETVEIIPLVKRNKNVETIHLIGLSLSDINFDYLCKIKPFDTVIEAEIISAIESFDKTGIDLDVTY